MEEHSVCLHYSRWGRGESRTVDGALSIKPAQLTHGSGNYTTERVLSMQISGDIGLGKCRLPMEKKEMTARG